MKTEFWFPGQVIGTRPYSSRMLRITVPSKHIRPGTKQYAARKPRPSMADQRQPKRFFWYPLIRNTNTVLNRTTVLSSTTFRLCFSTPSLGEIRFRKYRYSTIHQRRITRQKWAKVWPLKYCLCLFDIPPMKAMRTVASRQE